MFNSSDGFTMPVVPQCSNGGFNDGNSWWWIILLILIFGGYNGYGANGAGAYDNYVLTSDFSTLSRQMSDGFNSQERKLDGIANGICSLGYDQLAQMNGINTNITNVGGAIQTQLADCCCKTQQNIKDTQYIISNTGSDISRGVERGFADTNYNLATQANNITNTISTGLCQTNYNAQTNTRDIVDSQNANTQAILNKLCQMETNAKDEKIAELTAMNSDLRLAASQAAQNSYLISELGQKTPVPAYVVANPYCNCGSCCGC